MKEAERKRMHKKIADRIRDTLNRKVVNRFVESLEMFSDEAVADAAAMATHDSWSAFLRSLRVQVDNSGTRLLLQIGVGTPVSDSSQQVALTPLLNDWLKFAENQHRLAELRKAASELRRLSRDAEEAVKRVVDTQKRTMT